jgi:hypothetical protein
VTRNHNLSITGRLLALIIRNKHTVIAANATITASAPRATSKIVASPREKNGVDVSTGGAVSALIVVVVDRANVDDDDADDETSGACE